MEQIPEPLLLESPLLLLLPQCSQALFSPAPFLWFFASLKPQLWLARPLVACLMHPCYPICCYTIALPDGITLALLLNINPSSQIRDEGLGDPDLPLEWDLGSGIWMKTFNSQIYTMGLSQEKMIVISYLDYFMVSKESIILLIYSAIWKDQNVNILR